jgi:hypothetical protein
MALSLYSPLDWMPGVLAISVMLPNHQVIVVV